MWRCQICNKNIGDDDVHYCYEDVELCLKLLAVLIENLHSDAATYKLSVKNILELLGIEETQKYIVAENPNNPEGVTS